ncbi:DUF305 domain-containing protein [Streptomyces virginiae]|uniref:DUF305 domain-containing protein n=1 Tax=Streptomyces virginiae TaxID=1961 RepID=UPI0030E3BAC7
MTIHFGMPGMMDDQDVTRLGNARSNAFDTVFLPMMVEHHEGVIGMTKTEKPQGTYGPAKALADEIVTSQAA